MHRPFRRTCERSFREPVSSTMSATLRAAWLPLRVATPRLACVNAGTSFTPSPTMATRCPSSHSVRTTSPFCSGVRRPKTAMSLADRANSASSPVARSRPETVRSDISSRSPSPNCLAVAATVSRGSEDKTLISTPDSEKVLTVSLASGRIRSEKRKKHKGIRSAGNWGCLLASYSGLTSGR